MSKILATPLFGPLRIFTHATPVYNNRAAGLTKVFMVSSLIITVNNNNLVVTRLGPDLTLEAVLTQLY